MTKIVTDIEDIRDIITELKSVPDIFIGETVRFCQDQKEFNHHCLTAVQGLNESIETYAHTQATIIEELRERIRELENILEVRYKPKTKEYIQ